MTVAVAIAVVAAGCAGGDSTDSDGDNARTSTSTGAAPIDVDVDQPPAGSPVSADDLAAAQRAVGTFLRGLHDGDFDTAAGQVGPSSAQFANQSGGIVARLKDGVDQLGPWAVAEDRTVTSVGLDVDLIVVILDGTVEVNGQSSTASESFPVVLNGASQTWQVEPWGTAGVDAPIELAVEGQVASVTVREGVEQSPAAGGLALPQVWVSFFGQPAIRQDASAGQTTTFGQTGPLDPAEPSADSGAVVAVVRSGSVIYSTEQTVALPS